MCHTEACKAVSSPHHLRLLMLRLLMVGPKAKGILAASEQSLVPAARSG